MRVLNSSKLFREHYVRRAGNVFDVAKAVVGGGTVAGGIAGGSALAAGHAAAAASAWSLGANLPWIGTFFAGKAAAVGWTAGMTALGSAPVLIPAALVGCGVAYGICRLRKRKTIQKGSSVEELANAFAHVALLPVMALAVTTCRANPANDRPIREYLVGEMGAWGYAEPYVNDCLADFLRQSPETLNGRYRWAIGQLESGSTHGIGATPAELPAKAVRGFAEDFVRDFTLNVG